MRLKAIDWLLVGAGALSMALLLAVTEPSSAKSAERVPPTNSTSRPADLSQTNVQCPFTLVEMRAFADGHGSEHRTYEGNDTAVYLSRVNHVYRSQVSYDRIFTMAGGDGEEFSWLIFEVRWDTEQNVDRVCSPYLLIAPQVNELAANAVQGLDT